jgi:hypothetical protein
MAPPLSYFSGRVPAGASQAYLRRGTTLIPSEVMAVGVGQIRYIPTVPLDVGVIYHLVLDATEELAIQVEKETDDTPSDIAVARTPGAIRM